MEMIPAAFARMTFGNTLALALAILAVTAIVNLALQPQIKANPPLKFLVPGIGSALAWVLVMAKVLVMIYG
jgi:hypothetical protein